MASRAIPSHLKPSAAAGNAEDGGQRHHGKTASHFVSTTCSSASFCCFLPNLPTPLSPIVLDKELCRPSLLPAPWKGCCKLASSVRGGDDRGAKGAPHSTRTPLQHLNRSWTCRPAAVQHGADYPFQSVAQATCLLLRSRCFTHPVISCSSTNYGVADRHKLGDIFPPPHRTTPRRHHGIQSLDDDELISNRRPGFREHLDQRRGLADAECPQQARRHGDKPRGEEGTHPTSPTHPDSVTSIMWKGACRNTMS